MQGEGRVKSGRPRKCRAVRGQEGGCGRVQEHESPFALILEAPPAIKHAPLLMFCESFAAGGRAHARQGRGCERTAKEKRGLVEGKREDVMVFKNTGHLVP